MGSLSSEKQQKQKDSSARPDGMREMPNSASDVTPKQSDSSNADSPKNDPEFNEALDDLCMTLRKNAAISGIEDPFEPTEDDRAMTSRELASVSRNSNPPRKIEAADNSVSSESVSTFQNVKNNDPEQDSSFTPSGSFVQPARIFGQQGRSGSFVQPSGGSGPFVQPSGGSGPFVQPSGGSGPFVQPSGGSGPFVQPSGGSGPFVQPLNGSGSFAQPLSAFTPPGSSGSFAQPLNGSGSFAQPLNGSGSFAQPLNAFTPSGSSGSFAQPFEGGEFANFKAYAELAGKNIDADYRLGSQIGRGGCAIVYEAWRLSDEMHVVIKVLHSATLMSDEETNVAIKRFIREAELISSLDEQHIVKCVDYGLFQGTPCMVLEFVDGLSLDQLLANFGALPLAYASGIIEQLLCALTETHSKGIIHRDIKPGNIMVFDSPPPYEIRVLDFGISTVLDNLQSQTLMTQQGNVRGTPSYMAPELFTGETRASAESDLYAVGLVYLECLTGKPAVLGENFMRVAYKQVNDELDIPGSIPPCIADIIRKMCAKSCEDRYHSAQCALDDIRANLGQALKEEDKCATEWLKKQAHESKRRKKKSPASLMTEQRSVAKKNRAVFVVAGVLVFCVFAGIIMGYVLASDDETANIPAAVQNSPRVPDKTDKTVKDDTVSDTAQKQPVEAAKKDDAGQNPADSPRESDPSDPVKDDSVKGDSVNADPVPAPQAEVNPESVREAKPAPAAKPAPKNPPQARPDNDAPKRPSAQRNRRNNHRNQLQRTAPPRKPTDVPVPLPF